ncbi:MAG: sulfotransferase [Phycisphaeraceae bacterium]|nr:sulfotransferase [Phycisphaeraceae bacterium]MCW5755286.1 sulfotransferase [Phycisphaeraceae bacterium]
MSMYEGPPPIDIARALQQAAAMARAGRLGEAASLCQRVLSQSPGNPEALLLLAELHLHAGRPAEAIAACEAVHAAHPKHAGAMIALSRMHAFTGNLPKALELAERAVEAAPLDPDAQLWRGLTMNRARRFTDARKSIRKAIDLAAGQPQTLLRMAQALNEHERLDDAEECLDQVAALPGAPAALLVRLAAIRERKRAYDSARATYEQALAIDPDTPGALLGLARMQDRIGQDEECLATIERLLQRAPGDAVAIMTKSRVLRRQKRHDDAAAMLREEAARTPRQAPDRGMLLIELGHVLDSLGQYDEAFTCVRDGQLLWGQSPAAQRHPPERFLDWVERGPRWITPEILSTWTARSPDDGLPDPVFFLGFPRSGTTLTEQMLDAHPNLVTSDELPLVREVMEELRLRIAPGVPYPDHLADLTDAHLRRCRAAYWQQAQMRMGDALDGKRLIDKSPLNTWRLLVIRRVFPEAKVLFALRDPRDVCLSCFFQRFNPNPGMVLFQTLEGTARLYTAVMNAWLKYRDILGLEWMQTRYEDLVEDVDTQARKLIDFIGEPWDDRVIDYHENLADKVVSTPSYMSVRRPIYKKSIARWKRYENHLAPILDQLQPFVEAFGYE